MFHAGAMSRFVLPHTFQSENGTQVIEIIGLLSIGEADAKKAFLEYYSFVFKRAEQAGEAGMDYDMPDLAARSGDQPKPRHDTGLGPIGTGSRLFH
jgi:hypothetical protein